MRGYFRVCVTIVSYSISNCQLAAGINHYRVTLFYLFWVPGTLFYIFEVYCKLDMFINMLYVVCHMLYKLYYRYSPSVTSDDCAHDSGYHMPTSDCSTKPYSVSIVLLIFLSLSLSLSLFLCCAHKKSFNTAIPVRSLGPYMRVHYCTDIVHILYGLISFF